MEYMFDQKYSSHCMLLLMSLHIHCWCRCRCWWVGRQWWCIPQSWPPDMARTHTAGHSSIYKERILRSILHIDLLNTHRDSHRELHETPWHLSWQFFLESKKAQHTWLELGGCFSKPEHCDLIWKLTHLLCSMIQQWW